MQYTISGKVIKGDGYGKKIGYPTINLDRRNFLKIKPIPRFGVYSGEVFIENKIYRAGIIIGPLDKNGKPKIEAHLLSFKGNLYGKKVILKTKKFLRVFKNFKTEGELIKQIDKDIKMC